MFFVRCPEMGAAEDVAAYHLGGLLLFGRDYKDADGGWLSAEELTAKLESYQAAADIPLFIGSDEDPVSALLMACGNLLGNDIISGMSNITLMMVFGIVVQALAECFISPRYLEYFSLQAPKGEEGMYLGFSHLHSFLSSIFGFGIAGVLLTKYCPDPVLFETREAWEAASVNAHYIWYYFAVIGLVAAIALFVFAKTTEFIDKKKKA